MSDSSDDDSGTLAHTIQYGDDLPIDSTNDDDDDDDDDAQEGETFDTNLPTTHKYLGKLNTVSGYTLFDDGEVIELLAIHTKTLVFPGFTLPLVMNTELEQTTMDSFLKKCNIFVLVCADEMGSRLYKYGITMEVFESVSQNGTLYLKAKGRQRCKILPSKEIQHLGGRLQKVTVQILAEPSIKSPIACTQLLSLCSRRPYVFTNYNELLRNYKYRQYHLAQFPCPSWVYDRNEVCFYVKHMLHRLVHFYLKENIPVDPVTLSYWFIQNFQLCHEERLHLMKLDSALERLKTEITRQSQVFAMSKDGVQSNYCNPGGYVYETVTVVKAKNFNLVGNPSNEFSWFPGYWWTIMQCRLCQGHIGWKFASNHLQPRVFYGLAKSGLEIRILAKNESNDLD
ncbi:hypothetical protein RI129_012259 [Pyrocoelia pectoralis]|uniref:CULT domain-containing protein n=1 Tax=Pyrocoelia pectoralis TaxID=417401 RepID=A0AAN7V5U1_9COLE